MRNPIRATFTPPRAARLADLQIEFHAEALLSDEGTALAVREPDEAAGGAVFLHRLAQAQTGRLLAVARTLWFPLAGPAWRKTEP